ncbi:uncharacterized protein PV09_05326 [Verruconis gallopava]|uniref:Tubulin gamma chain n=1 Tax=Verruconis gallopava TaxID=253628 RepID=A0A0D1XM95_9PEZI|nr:uncharacterized protein PV09_05326 [Verruconis gallopava]KIW03571.1 hypothetical protein PV09_05326 [Verruconis gallopava]
MTSKAEIIEERKANLPLPDQPPQASDWQSADARTVNVGSGGVQGDVSAGGGSDSLRGPATGDSAARIDGSEWGTHTSDLNVGRTAKDGLSGLPNDAVTRDKKNAAGLEDTTGADYGYPQKSDPSSGVK